MTQTARKAQAAPKIDVLVESGLWNDAADAKSVVRRAIAEAAATLSTPGAELAIVLTDDSAIRLLNRTWRGVDTATNVLSFPTGRNGGDPMLIGDIVLAYETIATEARAEGKPVAHHLAHLAVHGFLHLLGYDHERKKDAEAMERLERDILHRLAIPDPYQAGRPGLKSDVTLGV
ncbi:MAG: rRNA maturation RNase YbeY [Xanthobacteraceae bacterium]